MNQSWNSEPDGSIMSKTITFRKRSGYSFRDGVSMQMFQLLSSWLFAWNPFWFRSDLSSSRNDFPPSALELYRGLMEMSQKDLKMGQFHSKRGGIATDGSLILKKSNLFAIEKILKRNQSIFF